MNDKSLRQDFLAELEFEPSIDAANIGVAAGDGIVTLSGHVKSYAEKAIAEEAVLRARRTPSRASTVATAEILMTVASEGQKEFWHSTGLD